MIVYFLLGSTMLFVFIISEEKSKIFLNDKCDEGLKVLYMIIMAIPVLNFFASYSLYKYIAKTF